MSAASNLRSEDQFLCSICLDVFTDPVTTPCGHNFCKNCITTHWDISDRCQCPMCKKVFKRRPELHINTLLSEVVAQFKLEAQQKTSSSSSEQQVSKPGEVPCDVCTGTKLKALKSCLVCLTSYCETHLEPPNHWLILSNDRKQVHCGDVRKNLQDNPQRFSNRVFVLGKQSFSSGRFYFEVQVKGKTDWDLGVARESINRKGDITLSPQNGYWTIWLRNGNEYKALADPPVRLSLKSQPEKVGVFVDHEEGLVSFYDVAAAALIYSFTGCSFTEKLYPFFIPVIMMVVKTPPL
ncbi:nuclear factor 7, brain-like [Seriola lalandi dorsalis]|uniref:nuclear factor 7, brain-like n=1 Tax=Seriola lalandi dorsalis TaxID=1841481 RepID=UPI000C6F4FCD|nr:nuclear factor 7, brain-like [Seriola lalandi dorsalis]